MAIPSAEQSRTRVVRFDTFELDLRSGELRRDRARVKVAEQPFAVLALLVTQPGEVVTREELQKKLWPADTFIDFDRGLNKAINRLREALGDSADAPRFIETLPKRGYRFVAGAVERSPVPVQPPTSQLPELPALPPAESPTSRKRRFIPWIFAIAVALVAVVSALIDSAKRDLDQLDRTTSECMDAVRGRTAGMFHAQQMLKARAECARSRRQVAVAYEASGATLKEHLQALDHAQKNHVSRELKALIALVEARVDIERAVELRRVMSSVKRMRAFADEAMQAALKEWR